MANAIYDKYKEALMCAANNVSLVDGNLKISLVDANTTFFTSTDEFYANLDAVANGIIVTANLDNASVVSGVLNADDVLFESVNTAIECETLLLWIDTADANTSRLVAWLDTNIDGLPITPDGSNVEITWSASGIFKL